MNKARIAVGGLQHETNTFAPSKATYEDFVSAGGWPGLVSGGELFDAVAGINLPVAGFVAKAHELGAELVPLSWSYATPSAHVTEDAFERLSELMLRQLAEAGKVDGLYLDLHGAMVCEHHDDGEGELLRRVRARMEPNLPIVISLDLHANVTPQMFELADRIVIYRTYPHVDMAATGARAAREMHRILAEGKGYKAFRQLPFLIPLTSGCTLSGPAEAVYRRLAELEKGEITSLSFACGFCPADIYHCGASLVAYGRDASAVEAAADSLLAEAVGREAEFAMTAWAPEAAVSHAMQRLGARPIILADAQDNPGGGGNSDTTGLLQELLKQRAPAVLAILYDPEAARRAHAAGEGADIAVSLGAHSGLPGHHSITADFRVECLGDGVFTADGPFYGGARMRLGPMALLSLDTVKIIVGSRKEQAADQAMFRHLRVEPCDQKILVLKSTVHFRADFQAMAEEILVVAAPGPTVLDNHQLEFRNLRPGLRRMPGDPH